MGMFESKKAKEQREQRQRRENEARKARLRRDKEIDAALNERPWPIVRDGRKSNW